jgi:hypothetical protein
MGAAGLSIDALAWVQPGQVRCAGEAACIANPPKRPRGCDRLNCVRCQAFQSEYGFPLLPTEHLFTLYPQISRQMGLLVPAPLLASVKPYGPFLDCQVPALDELRQAPSTLRPQTQAAQYLKTRH